MRERRRPRSCTRDRGSTLRAPPRPGQAAPWPRRRSATRQAERRAHGQGSRAAAGVGCMPGNARSRATTWTSVCEVPSVTVCRPVPTPTETAGSRALERSSLRTAERTSGGQCASSTRPRLAGSTISASNACPRAGCRHRILGDLGDGYRNDRGIARAGSMTPWTSEPFATKAFSVLLATETTEGWWQRKRESNPGRHRHRQRNDETSGRRNTSESEKHRSRRDDHPAQNERPKEPSRRSR